MPPVEQEVKSAAGIPLQPAEGTGSVGRTETRVKGESVKVPSAQVEGRTVLRAGKWLKMAAVQDEELVEGGVIPDSAPFISQLQRTGLRADLFTFAQELPIKAPQFSYHLEWDSLAVIPIATYSDWWEKRATQDVRAAVKKSVKQGVIVKEAKLDDGFVEGIVRIYNECEYRQGKPFWHYGKDFETIKRISSTYPDRSTFIGAYFNEELIGFIKMVRVGNMAKTLHVISMKKYSNKKPTNALIAKAVEICANKGYTRLMYGNYVYADPKSSLTEFKRRNGFEELLVPRYYIPLSLKGRIALRLNLHRGLAAVLPLTLLRTLIRVRELIAEFSSAKAD